MSSLGTDPTSTTSGSVELSEDCDAIREGDGERVLRCWRYLLPVFKSSGRKNEVLNMLCQFQYELTPRHAQELIWSRFVSTHEAPGRNIPSDLHQEHLNRIVKDAIRGLNTNKTEWQNTWNVVSTSGQL